jgi:hypothetical protein
MKFILTKAKSVKFFLRPLKGQLNLHRRGFLFAGRLAISVCRLVQIGRTPNHLCTI